MDSIALFTGTSSGLGHAVGNWILKLAGAEAAQATLSGHHQLTVGLLHSPSDQQPKKENK